MVTQREVAQMARTSTATVSAVINGNKFVSNDLKERVLKAIEELNYEVNALARSFKTNKTKLVGLVYRDLTDGYYMPLINAIEGRISEYGYSLVLSCTKHNPSKELEFLKVLRSINVKNIIIAMSSNYIENVEYIENMVRNGTNIVLLDTLIEGKEDKYDAVLVNNAEGAYNGVKFLVDNGYRKIGTINTFLDISTGRERLQGYRKALAESDLKENERHIKTARLYERRISDLALELLNDEDRPDAIFCANNVILVETLKIINQTNLIIPDDIGILSFDDISWLNVVGTPITSIGQPLDMIGRTAVELLFNRINQVHKKPKKAVVRVLDTELIVRGSYRKH